MRPFFLAIDGPIGVGKTTLARLLQPRFQTGLLLEAFEENPFLSRFYNDRARYAFQTQLFFLLSRYRQHQEIPSRTVHRPLIADYTFGKDALFACLNLEGDELAMYRRLYTLLAEQVVPPDLVIYLQAETDVLMARIAARDRPYEREMDRNYIAEVNHAYEHHFGGYAATTLLTIDTSDLNYVQDAGALAFVEREVRKALGVGAYQEALPQIKEMGHAKVAPVPRAQSRQAVPRRAVQDFLAANEAMGRLGRLLAGAEDGDPHRRLFLARESLAETTARLASLEESMAGDRGA